MIVTFICDICQSVFELSNIIITKHMKCPFMNSFSILYGNPYIKTDEINCLLCVENVE